MRPPPVYEPTVGASLLYPHDDHVGEPFRVLRWFDSGEHVPHPLLVNDLVERASPIEVYADIQRSLEPDGNGRNVVPRRSLQDGTPFRLFDEDCVEDNHVRIFSILRPRPRTLA